MTKLRARLVPILASIALVSCGGDSASPTDPETDNTPAQVVVAPSSLSLDHVGASVQLNAQVKNSSGSTVSAAVTWSSGNDGVVEVSSAGLAVATGPGTTAVTATAGTASTSVPVVVEQAPAQLNRASGNGQSGTAGEVLDGPVVITVMDEGGHPVEGVSVTWTPDSGSGVLEDAATTTDAAGEAPATWRLGPAPGSQSLVASVSGVGSVTFSAMAEEAPVATVSITPPAATVAVGASGQFNASAVDASGNLLSDRVVTWSSSAPSVASVSTGGVVTGLSPGTTVISGTSEGVTGTASLTVSSAAVASITIQPPGGTLDVGAAGWLEATVRDAQGNELPDREVSWATSDPNVVSGYAVGQIAVVTGISTGVATISASAEGKTTQVQIQVVSGGGTNVCSQIAGASLFASDGTFLGTLSNPYNSTSIYNEYGTYGSPYSSLSVYNPYGPYGSQYSSTSAFNPYATNPPVIVKNGNSLAYFTMNVYKTPVVTPEFAETCSFP